MTVNVNGSSSDTVTCSVFTGEGYGGILLGQINVVLNATGPATIDLSSLSKGMYFVKVKAAGQEKTVKITKN